MLFISRPYFFACRFEISIFIFDISTPVGHSRLQALQATHNFIVSVISLLVSAFLPNCPERANLSELALPLVESFSSFVTLKEGHITPPSSFLHDPLLLHISIAPWRPPALPGH